MTVLFWFIFIERSMTRRLPVWKVYDRVPFVNGRYGKGVSFLPKIIYKRVRGRTSGRSLPVLTFFLVPPGPRGWFYSVLIPKGTALVIIWASFSLRTVTNLKFLCFTPSYSFTGSYTEVNQNLSSSTKKRQNVWHQRHCGLKTKKTSIGERTKFGWQTLMHKRNVNESGRWTVSQPHWTTVGINSSIARIVSWWSCHCLSGS